MNKLAIKWVPFLILSVIGSQFMPNGEWYLESISALSIYSAGYWLANHD